MSFEAILNYSFNGFKAGCHEVGICSKIEVRISKGGDSRSKAWQVRFRTKLIESLRFESEYELSEILFQVRVWSWELFEVRNAGSELFEVLSSRISMKIESVFWNWSPVWNIRLFELWSFRIGEAWESWLKIAGRLKLKYLVKLFKPRTGAIGQNKFEVLVLSGFLFEVYCRSRFTRRKTLQDWKSESQI